jgi:hypothetical protein
MRNVLRVGRLIYRFRGKFGHGLYTAWRRDVFRWRILKTEPVYGLTDGTCEIHVLTCDRDWLDLIWCLKSLFAVCEYRFRLCIHEDGSVPPHGITALRAHFPDARLILRDEADQAMRAKLKGYPRCQSVRDTNVLSLKVFDFANYLESDRMMLLDCDILFFKRPAVLLQRITDPSYPCNSLNKDWAMGYSVDASVAQKMLPFDLQLFINSGLGLIHRRSYEVSFFEEWLELPEILSHSHRIEQTLVGLACSRFGHEFLPKEYDVRLTRTEPSQVVKHYTGPIRHLMYREGLSRVMRSLSLNSSSRRYENIAAIDRWRFLKGLQELLVTRGDGP